MATEEDKGKKEVAVFLEFVSISKFPAKVESVRKNHDEFPDIVCESLSGETCQFEMAEILEENYARNRFNESFLGGWFKEPTLTVLEKKFAKTYSDSSNVNLLLYVYDSPHLSQSTLTDFVDGFLKKNGKQFKSIWIFDRLERKILYPIPPKLT